MGTTMDQNAIEEVLARINEAGGIDFDMNWWWSGYESDPVVTSEHMTVGGAHMLLQTTQSGLMPLNGKVVEPAVKESR